MAFSIEEIEVKKSATKKTTVLGAFGATKAPPKPQPAAARPQATPILVAPIAIPPSSPGKRGPAKTYEQPRRGVTLRLTDEQHDALRQFAFEERTTIQDLALRGIAKMFEERGLPKPW